MTRNWKTKFLLTTHNSFKTDGTPEPSYLRHFGLLPFDFCCCLLFKSRLMTEPRRFDNIVYASEFIKEQYNYSISGAIKYVMDNMFIQGTDKGVWLNLPQEND